MSFFSPLSPFCLPTMTTSAFWNLSGCPFCNSKIRIQTLSIVKSEMFRTGEQILCAAAVKQARLHDLNRRRSAKPWIYSIAFLWASLQYLMGHLGFLCLSSFKAKLLGPASSRSKFCSFCLITHNCTSVLLIQCQSNQRELPDLTVLRVPAAWMLSMHLVFLPRHSFPLSLSLRSN